MTAVAGTSEGLVVAVTVVATLVIVALLAALASMLRAARQLRRAADGLETEVRRVLRSVDGTLAQASADLERVDDLIGSAEQLTGTVSSASQAAVVTLASPVIKVMAFSRGTSRAWRRLRRSDDRSTAVRR